MATLSEDTLTYLRSSPFFAMLEGRDQAAKDLFYAKFEKLPDAVRQFLLAPATAEEVSYIAVTSRLDERYLPAIGKIVASVALGDVPANLVGQLLEKLSIPPDQATQIAANIVKLLEPVATAKAQAVVQAKPREIPPMTRTVGGIIDLRKPPAT